MTEISQADVERVGNDELVFMHRTEVHGRRMYSIHTLVLPDGTIRDVYFDVTARSSLGAGRPNQALEPTSGTVTDRDARSAPVPPVAHL